MKNTRNIRPMKRTVKQPSAILTSDWHLREDTPICRKDNFWVSQWKDVKFVRDLQKKYGCPVLHAGDLFDHWKPSPMLLSCTIRRLPEHFITVLGNHDLPQHNLDLRHKCGVMTLYEAGKLTILDHGHWGTNELKENSTYKNFRVSINHIGVYEKDKPYPGCSDIKALSLLKKYDFDLILTGHNHKSFTAMHKTKWLVNPGSLNRQTVGELDNRPRVYLWYAETRTLESVYIPLDYNEISTDHLQAKKRKEKQLSAFVTSLNDGFKAEVTFEKNLEKFINKNNIRQATKDIIYEAIE